VEENVCYNIIIIFLKINRAGAAEETPNGGTFLCNFFSSSGFPS